MLTFPIPARRVFSVALLLWLFANSCVFMTKWFRRRYKSRLTIDHLNISYEGSYWCTATVSNVTAESNHVLIQGKHIYNVSKLHPHGWKLVLWFLRIHEPSQRSWYHHVQHAWSHYYSLNFILSVAPLYYQFSPPVICSFLINVRLEITVWHVAW